jgi:hypothetical protein
VALSFFIFFFVGETRQLKNTAQPLVTITQSEYPCAPNSNRRKAAAGAQKSASHPKFVANTPVHFCKFDAQNSAVQSFGPALLERGGLSHEPALERLVAPAVPNSADHLPEKSPARLHRPRLRMAAGYRGRGQVVCAVPASSSRMNPEDDANEPA